MLCRGIRPAVRRGAAGRSWRLETDARRTLLVENLRPPVNGLTLHDEHLYVSEGGHPARISRFDLDGHGQTVILENLPGPGNYHTIMVAFAPDAKQHRHRRARRLRVGLAAPSAARS